MYFPVDSPGRFAERVSGLPREADDYFLILLADRHLERLPEIVSALNDRKLGFFGAVVPGLIHERKQYLEGAVVRPVPCIGQPAVARLGAQGHEWLARLVPPTEITQGKPTLYLFIDCLSPNITGFLADLFNRYGNAVNYFGGGAGNRVLSHGPAVFTAEGIYRNAAVAAIVDLHGAVSVRHGWERVGGPFVATRTHNNIIQELNWEPAMEVYRRALPAELRDVAPDEFYSRVAASYPFGIQKAGREDVVRDPVRTTSNGGLVCLSDVPTHSVMYLLHGDPERLIQAAGEAVGEVTGDQSSPVVDCLVCDCYSRTLLLGEVFGRELDAVGDRLAAVAPGLGAEGGIVLGEIASDGEQSLEFYNKTFVVSVVYA